MGLMVWVVRVMAIFLEQLLQGGHWDWCATHTISFYLHIYLGGRCLCKDETCHVAGVKKKKTKAKNKILSGL